MRGELRAAYDLAETQGWSVSRTQLTALGVTRWMVRDRLTSGTWVRWGTHTVGLRRGDLEPVGHRWRAVWETGPTAALDGSSALVVAGLTGFEERELHVSVPRGRAPRQVDGVRRHVVVPRGPDELMGAGIPRTHVDLAVTRAAQWADSDRQAGLLLVMSAQQRLLPLARLPGMLEAHPPHRRRALIAAVVGDVVAGAQALGELDLGVLCRRYDLPPPTRQVVRTTARGRCYLDAGWPEIRLFIEVDGLHHFLGEGPLEDALRQNEIVIGGDAVMRIPLLGLRVHESELMEQVARAYRVMSSRAAA